MDNSDHRSGTSHEGQGEIHQTHETDNSSSTAWPLDSPMFMRRPIRRTAEMLGSDHRSSSHGKPIVTRRLNNRRTREVAEQGTRQPYRTDRTAYSKPQTQAHRLPEARPDKRELSQGAREATKQGSHPTWNRRLLWIGGIIAIHILLNLLVANLIAIANETAPALAVFRGCNPTFLYADDANQILGLGPYIPGWLLSKQYAEHGLRNYKDEFSSSNLLAQYPKLGSQPWSDQIIPFGQAIYDAYLERLKHPSAMHAMGYQNVNPVNSLEIKRKFAPDLPRFKEGCRCDLPSWITTLRNDAIVPFWLRKYQASPSTVADLEDFCPPCRFKQAHLATRDTLNHLPPPLPRYLTNSAFLNAEPRWFYERVRQHLNARAWAKDVRLFPKNSRLRLIEQGWAVPSDFFDYSHEAVIESRRKVEKELKQKEDQKREEKRAGWRREEEEARKRNEA